MNDRKFFGVLTIALLVIIGFSIYAGFLHPFKAKEKPVVIPQEIMGMQQVSLLTGAEAEKSVNGLHGLEIPLKNAYIASYQGTDGSSAIIWVSESFTKQDAQKLFNAMDSKMPGNSFFSDYKKLRYKGLDLRYVYWPKMNMHDYYYLIGKNNYWLAISTDKDINVFLDEFMAKQ